MAQTKRSLDDTSNLLDGVKVLLVDIEGTIVPNTFVKDKLLSYITDNVEEYLGKNWESEELQADLTALREQAASVEGAPEIKPADASQEEVVASVVTYAKSCANEGQTGSLLVDHMWREAYKTNKVNAELFPDVVQAFKQFTANTENKVFSLSSTSVEAQKLLFSHTSAGDISEDISGYFDSKTGSNVDTNTYNNIVNEVGCKAEEILFLSDLPAKARAASKANLTTVLVCREGGAAVADEDKKDINTITGLGELVASNESNKRTEEVNGDSNDAEVVEDENGDEDVEDDVEDEDEEDGDDDVPETEDVSPSEEPAE